MITDLPTSMGLPKQSFEMAHMHTTAKRFRLLKTEHIFFTRTVKNAPTELPNLTEKKNKKKKKIRLVEC
jgi:hypothetical protein